MKDFDYYLMKVVEELDKESYTREQRKIHKREVFITSIMLFFCLIILFCCIYGIIKNDSLETQEVNEVITDNGSLPGDKTVASGYASIELLKAEGLYEEPVITYTNSATFKVTHYCGCSICCGKWSSGSEDKAVGASGTNLKAYQSIAVDPKVIPLGTILHDNTGKQYVAEDTGSAINGYRIDIFTGNHQEAKELGVNEIELYW